MFSFYFFVFWFWYFKIFPESSETDYVQTTMSVSNSAVSAAMLSGKMAVHSDMLPDTSVSTQ